MLCLLVLVAGGGCGMRHLARTVGQGRGELRAMGGGPFLGVVGVPILVPTVRIGGRYGLTDWLDVDGSVGIDPLAFAVLSTDVGLVLQLYRQRGGVAVSASARGHFLFDLDDNLTPRGFPEIGLHAEGPLADGLSLFGGVVGLAQFDPPLEKPPAFIAPYLGLEVMIDRRAPVREALGLQVAWISPWDDLGGLASWEPVGYGALVFMVGWRALYGSAEVPDPW